LIKDTLPVALRRHATTRSRDFRKVEKYTSAEARKTLFFVFFVASWWIF